MSGKSLPLRLLIALIILTLVTAGQSQAQGSPTPAVEIDCNEKSPMMNVHPVDHDSVTITCTVRNPSSYDEVIQVDKELEEGQPSIDMMLSEDSFNIAAGEEESFQVEFSSSQTRLSASISLDFSLTARVTQITQANIPAEIFNVSAEVTGTLGIEKYGMVELEQNGVSTINMVESEEAKFQFVFSNNGNDRDKIRVTITNEQELVEKGFSFPLGTFVSEDVDENSQSSIRELSIRTPNEIPTTERISVILEAESTNEPDSPKSEIKITISLEASASNTGLSGNLEEVSKDDVVKYAGIGGSAILGLVILILAVKSVGRKSNDNIEYEEPAPIEVDDDDEFDDLMDSLAEFDEIDDFDAALDEF